ncbi:SOS response-associated peptidase [Microbacterium sp. NPDC056052]|uniref:SOS response-associated peptidase n=1 Tax=Microbacterium sp. NPDC056052 TaxID=3345695 RepID=UPI0035DCE636
MKPARPPRRLPVVERKVAAMCGRFAMDAKTDELIREFVAGGGDPQDWWKEWHGSYSIAPTDQAPIIRDRGDGRFLELVRWDWEKPKNMRPGVPLINAGVEKLAAGFWAPAFTAARCVVPMRGYFEWTGEKGAKIPHYLHGDGLLTPDAMDAWLEPVKLDRPGRENMLSLLDGSSTAIASTIEQYVVDRKVNNTRTVDRDDPTVIAPAA